MTLKLPIWLVLFERRRRRRHAHPAAKAEIDHLLDYLAKSGCEFNRNGSWYGSKEARDHLNDKYQYLLKRLGQQRGKLHRTRGHPEQHQRQSLPSALRRHAAGSQRRLAESGAGPLPPAQISRSAGVRPAIQACRSATQLL